MDEKKTTRLRRLETVWVAAALLALLIAVGGEAYNWLDSFSGELCVGVSRAEHTAVRLAAAGASSSLKVELRARLRMMDGSVQHDLLPDEISFQDRETSPKLLNPQQRYDAVQLPFSMRLKRVAVISESDPRGAIRVSSQGTQRTVPIAAGGNVELDGVRYHVETIRKWSGLLRREGGEPMACLSLRRPGETWTENIFLAANAWPRFEPGVSVRFRWFDSEAGAREDLAKGLPGIESARWGAVDGSAIQWFGSFAPGTGAALSGGVRVTLLELDETHETVGGSQAAIEVQREKDDQAENVWVVANDPTPQAPLRFEYHARLDTVILVNGFADGAACVAAYHKEKPAGNAKLAAGETWRVEGAPLELRLDQVLSGALAVPEKDSTLHEAVLRDKDSELRLRQSEAVRRDDALLEFTRTAVPPVVRYEVAAEKPDGKPLRSFALGPDETVRYRNWRFSIGSPAAEPLRTAVLNVERASSQSWTRILMAIALAGLVWTALHFRHERKDEPH